MGASGIRNFGLGGIVDDPADVPPGVGLPSDELPNVGHPIGAQAAAGSPADEEGIV